MRVRVSLPVPTPAEAVRIQTRLCRRVVLDGDVRRCNWIAGVDVAHGSKRHLARAAVALVDARTLALVESALAVCPVEFPYVPGLLSFRELPAILQALTAIRQEPELILCDGQGYAHPRRFGLACHLGVLTGLPTIGVAKSRLVGVHADVPDRRGASRGLYDQGERIGCVLRSRQGVRPIYVSAGHRISHGRARALVLRCLDRYRLPEPTRLAHQLAAA